MILITHDDLDGAGCAVLATAAYDKILVYICNYAAVNDTVLDVLSGPDEILITDISVSPEIAEKIDRRGSVKLFDHHKTAAWLNRYPWAKVDSSCCGTMHLFNYLSQSHRRLKKYQDFTAVVNDYDLWLHKDPRSRQLNRLHYILGPHRFIKRFSADGRVRFRPEEKLLLDLEEEKIREYRAMLAGYEGVDRYGNKYLFVFAERYASELGKFLLEKHPDYGYVMIINARQYPTKVSLRSRGDVDVAAIAREYGGGGHKAAAGFVVKEPGYRALVQGWARDTKS
ncbi:DHHA1 domain-containing protein [Moorella naiadis]|uniref:DHHA1 domain-containing protein n=1 Tax=Moorella naiadis (nom. illeg.) TaxID=3093670 RepID=UPI003D9C84D7